MMREQNHIGLSLQSQQMHMQQISIVNQNKRLFFGKNKNEETQEGKENEEKVSKDDENKEEAERS